MNLKTKGSKHPESESIDLKHFGEGQEKKVRSGESNCKPQALACKKEAGGIVEMGDKDYDHEDYCTMMAMMVIVMVWKLV